MVMMAVMMMIRMMMMTDDDCETHIRLRLGALLKAKAGISSILFLSSRLFDKIMMIHAKTRNMMMMMMTMLVITKKMMMMRLIIKNKYKYKI